MERVIAVVGATATGKTALGIELASALDGEIVNADSRQVYRGMDIGTAKPSAAEQAAARHWLIDIADPDETFTLGRFIDLARDAIADILRRGKRPIVVGGTGQYVWALLEGWRVPRVPPDAELRRRYEGIVDAEGVDAVARELARLDPGAAGVVDMRNPRRIIRAIEVTVKTGRAYSEWRRTDPPAFDSRIIGLTMERGALYARTDARVDRMIEEGLVDEVRGLNEQGCGCELASFASIGYREVCAHLHDGVPLAEAVARIKTETHRLVRMQHAWFKADDARIRWFDAVAPGLAASATAYARDEAS